MYSLSIPSTLPQACTAYHFSHNDPKSASSLQPNPLSRFHPRRRRRSLACPDIVKQMYNLLTWKGLSFSVFFGLFFGIAVAFIQERPPPKEYISEPLKPAPDKTQTELPAGPETLTAVWYLLAILLLYTLLCSLVVVAQEDAIKPMQKRRDKKLPRARRPRKGKR